MHWDCDTTVAADEGKSWEEGEQNLNGDGVVIMMTQRDPHLRDLQPHMNTGTNTTHLNRVRWQKQTCLAMHSDGPKCCSLGYVKVHKHTNNDMRVPMLRFDNGTRDGWTHNRGDTSFVKKGGWMVVGLRGMGWWLSLVLLKDIVTWVGIKAIQTAAGDAKETSHVRQEIVYVKTRGPQHIVKLWKVVVFLVSVAYWLTGISAHKPTLLDKGGTRQEPLAHAWMTVGQKMALQSDI